MNKHGLYDIYGTWHVPFWQTKLFYIVFGFVLFILFAGIVYLLVKRYRSRKQKIAVTSWDRALHALESLQKEQKVRAEYGKEFYDTITAILKRYFHERYGWITYGKTDAELLADLKNKGFSQHLLALVTTILEGSLTIKFANAQAAQAQVESDFERTMLLIKQTIPSKD